MDLSTIISIAISLIFIYLLFSIVTSQIQELIAELLKLRAKNLKQYIRYLLGEEEDESESSITKKLYNEYLITSLNLSTKNNKKLKEPSEIKSKKFADGLI